jgi:hypothetical protein
MALSDKTGLTIKIGADVANAKKGIDDVRTSIGSLSNMAKGGGFEGLASGLLKLEGGLGAVAGPLAIATAGIGAVVGVAATAIGTMFALAQSAAEFGSQIYDMSVQTGLSATTLSALSVAAKQSDVEMGKVVQGLTKFSLLAGEAADGSDKATAKLAKFGLTSKDVSQDLEGSLAKVISKINELPAGMERSNAAAAAFGARGGKDMLKLIDQMDGDLPGLVQKMKELGLTIDDKAAKAADDFADNLTILGARIDMLKVKIGNELIPVVDASITALSEMLTESANDWQEWYQNNAGWIDAFRDKLFATIDFIIANKEYFAFFFPPGALKALEFTAKVREVAGRPKPEGKEKEGTFAGGGGEGSGDKAKKDAAAKKARDERIKALELEVKQILDDVKEADRMLADEMAKRETAPGIFREPTPGEVQASIENAIANLEEFYSKIRDARAKIAIEKMGGAETPAERLNIEKEFQLEDTALMREYQDKKNKILADGTARYNDIVKKGGEATLATIRRGGNEQLAFLKSLRDSQFLTEVEYLQAKLQIDNQLIDAEIEVQKQIAEAAEGDLEDRKAALDKIKDLNSQKVINEIETQNAIREAQKKPEERETALDRLKKTWKEYYQTIKDGAEDTEAALGTMGGMALDMLQNMEGALKSSIANWILYGDSVGTALKKALAAQLASFSAEATIWALKATALGLYNLAIGNFPAATKAFESAAVWAAVAVASGVTARALAKGTFENQSNRATTGGGSADRNTAGQGQAFSSQGNQTINATQSGVSLMPTAEIVIKDASGMFSQLFEAEIRNNSRVRRLIIDTANS